MEAIDLEKLSSLYWMSGMPRKIVTDSKLINGTYDTQLARQPNGGQCEYRMCDREQFFSTFSNLYF